MELCEHTHSLCTVYLCACVFASSLSHLLQILLEHLHHGLQLSHLPLQPYVTLTVEKKQTLIVIIVLIINLSLYVFCTFSDIPSHSSSCVLLLTLYICPWCYTLATALDFRFACLLSVVYDSGCSCNIKETSAEWQLHETEAKIDEPWWLAVCFDLIRKTSISIMLIFYGVWKGTGKECVWVRCYLDEGRDSGAGCSSMWGCWGLEAPLLRWFESPNTKLLWTVRSTNTQNYFRTYRIS